MQLETIIEHYHALLSNSDPRVLYAQLEAAQQERHMVVGKLRDRLVCSVLRPRFVVPAQYDTLQKAATTLGKAIRLIGDASLHDQHMLAPYALDEDELRLLRIDPGYPGVSAFGRLDGFLAADGSWCYFVESNLESPAGIAYDEAIAAMFDQTEVMDEFRKRFSAEAFPVRQALQAMLLENYRAWGVTGTPTIAIVDYVEAVTMSEFEWLRDCFIRDGLPTVIADPGWLRYQGGRLYADLRGADGQISDSVAIDLVYRRVLQHEFLARYDLTHPLVQAYAEHAVCVINPFCTKPVHSKLIMWLLSDEEGPAAHVLNAELRAAIAAHVPWSRLLRAGPTRYQGERVELLSFAKAQREKLVLKPNDEYGGKGVLLGWETPQEQWEQSLDAAQHEPYLLQERVPLPIESYPTWSPTQGLQFSERYVDSDPCVYGNQALGCLTRIAATSLLNVSAGGGSAPPTFLVQARDQGSGVRDQGSPGG